MTRYEQTHYILEAKLFSDLTDQALHSDIRPIPNDVGIEICIN